MPRRKITKSKDLGSWLIRYWIAEKQWQQANQGKDPRKHGGPQPDISAITRRIVDLDENDQLVPVLDRDNILHIVVPLCPEAWTIDDLEDILANDDKEIVYDDSALPGPDDDDDQSPRAGQGPKATGAQKPRKTAKKYKKQLGFVVMGGCR